MINLGLTTAEYNKLLRLLTSPHWIKVTIAVLDLEHRYITDLSDRLMAGQMDVATDADGPSRTVEMTLFDPKASTSLNPDSPDKGALFMDRMVRIIYSVADPLKTKWYDIPLFCGPITGLRRDDFTLVIQAAGKDSFGYDSVWDPHTYPENMYVTDICENILTRFMGETKKKIQMPKKGTGGKTDEDTVISRESTPWQVLKKMAKAMNRQVFYDARGVAMFRKTSTRPVITIDDKWIIARPNFTYDPSTLINAVRVEGGKPKGAEHKIIAREVAPAGHPLSPQRLGRNGTPRYFMEIVNADKVKNQADANAIAKKRLKEGLIESVEMQLTMLPLPLLEEGDFFMVKSDDVNMLARAMQWSIPLTHDGTMSLGNIKRVSFKSKRKKKKKPPREPKKPKTGTKQGKGKKKQSWEPA